ncbi:ABC-2 family transporter protein [bacterium]|nr:ABC-2 family transporter protein [bacterium]MBU1072584.1 ABC-2 family transporter protein [bacterium]
MSRRDTATTLPRLDNGWRRRMREPWRQTSIYAAYFAQFLKTRLAYRTDFLVDLLANLVSLGIQLSVLTVLFGKITSLKGWTFEQVLFIYGFSLLPLGLFNLVSINIYRFSESYIIEGDLDRVLLRPVNPLAQVLFSSFGMGGLNELFLGAAVMIYACVGLELAPNALDVLLLVPLAVAASLVYLGVFLGLTSVSFWIEDRMGLAPPVYNIIRFSRYPVTIFSPLVRIFLTFVLPFAWVAFYPATWFVGGPEYHRIAMFTPLVGVATFGLGYLVWLRGISRYASTGS